MTNILYVMGFLFYVTTSKLSICCLGNGNIEPSYLGKILYWFISCRSFKAIQIFHEKKQEIFWFGDSPPFFLKASLSDKIGTWFTVRSFIKWTYNVVFHLDQVKHKSACQVIFPSQLCMVKLGCGNKFVSLFVKWLR